MSTTLLQTHFADWAAALLTCDPDCVADLYADNATLLPTMANDVITDREGIEEYFVHFLSLKPRASILEEHVDEMGEEQYLHCGSYRFVTHAEEVVDARFTMVWQKQDGQWKILHHHSSRMPV